MRNNNNFRFCFYLGALLVLFFSKNSNCQVFTPEYIASVRAQYPSASAIMLKRSTAYKINIEKNQVKGRSYIHEELLINTETGLGFQHESIPTSGMVAARNIKPFVLVPKSNGYKKIKVKKFETKDNPDRNVFFDDQKLVSFSYPSAGVGAILVVDYEFDYNEPRFLGEHFWSGAVPIVEDLLQIEVDKNIHLDTRLFNVPEGFVKINKEVVKNNTIYTWKVLNRKSSVHFDDAPDFKYYSPHVIFFVTDYKIHDSVRPLLSHPIDLYKWYQGLIKDVNTMPDVNLKNVVDSLVRGEVDELEKVRKIFYWVQDNISYVAFEDGLGGLVPRDAGVVCSRRYGDCKDMASIINEMLRFANIPSYLTWIGSRSIPYKYSEVPTPVVDNHMICSYRKKDGSWLFLDGTGKKAPLELYTSFIQGKQAMIGISPDSMLLVEVPVKDTSWSQTIDSVQMQLEGSKLIGQAVAKLTGYDALDYFYRQSFKNADERQEFFKNYFVKGSNKVSFSQIRQLGGERQPILFTYNFVLPDYVREVALGNKKDEKSLMVNLNLDRSLILEKPNEGRQIPISFKHCTLKKLVVSFVIPSGYKLGPLPEDEIINTTVAGCSSTYKMVSNKVIHTTEIYINTLILKAEDFDKYNDIIDHQIKEFNQTLTLIPIQK